MRLPFLSLLLSTQVISFHIPVRRNLLSVFPCLNSITLKSKSEINKPITNVLVDKSQIIQHVRKTISIIAISIGVCGSGVHADDSVIIPDEQTTTRAITETKIKSDVTEKKIRPAIKFGDFKLPYNHENLPFKEFLGKATIVFNMKLDDPQTGTQLPDLVEIYRKYTDNGLNVLAFPTEQGYFEPDDDETLRAKALEYFSFGDFPKAVVFDKVDVLGPSANPLYTALTSSLPTPNGYDRITLNYEKFLLDSNGNPVRRYPRKFNAYDMEPDIIALLKGDPLPEESALFQKAWREAKRESIKSEYAFRYNYNYYTAPDSMYKYNPEKDR